MLYLYYKVGDFPEDVDINKYRKRTPFVCAEPAALGNLWMEQPKGLFRARKQKYVDDDGWTSYKTIPAEMTKSDWLKGVKYKSFAVGDFGPMAPCAVCSQWIDTASLKIKL